MVSSEISLRKSCLQVTSKTDNSGLCINTWLFGYWHMGVYGAWVLVTVWIV